MGDLNIDKVQVIYDEAIKELESCTDRNEFANIIKKSFYCLSEIIRTFFSGKQNEIKSIYKAIRFNKFPYNRVNSIDFTQLLPVYDEYLHGLIEFTEKFTKLDDDIDVDIFKIEEMIGKVTDRDAEFIHSLFNGKIKVESMDLDNVMKNIEELITINDNFESIMNSANDIMSVICSKQSTKYDDIINKGIKVYFKSICYYNCKCIEEILKCYSRIHDSIQTRTPAGGVKEVPKYQLF